jgi:hypothetical protein
MTSDFEFQSTRTYFDQADDEEVVSSPGPVVAAEEVKHLQINGGGVRCESLEEAYAILDQIKFEEVTVEVVGDGPGTLVSSAYQGEETNTIEAPDFVTGVGAVFLTYCQLHQIPCLIRRTAVPFTSSLYA